MRPAYLNRPIDVKQGDTFRLAFEIKDSAGDPIDLTGRHICMQWRSSPTTKPVMELTSENGRIVIDGAKLDLLIDAVDTQDIKPREYMFDLQSTLDDEVETLLSGKINVIPDVTYDCE